MCRTAGAVFVRFEQLPEEARNFIEKCRNTALMADVGASCGGVVGFRRINRFTCFCSAMVALPVAIFVNVFQ